MAKKGIKYIGMGVSGGEEGARNGVTLACFHHGTLAQHMVMSRICANPCSLALGLREAATCHTAATALRCACHDQHSWCMSGRRLSRACGCPLRLSVLTMGRMSWRRPQHDARRRQGGLQGPGADRQQGRRSGTSLVPQGLERPAFGPCLHPGPNTTSTPAPTLTLTSISILTTTQLLLLVLVRKDPVDGHTCNLCPTHKLTLCPAVTSFRWTTGRACSTWGPEAPATS